MILGIGTDIVNIKRIEELINKFGKRFINKILTKSEQEIFSLKKNKIAFLAKRFAAKEALAKALKTGIGKDLSFQDIAILNDPAGAPKLSLINKPYLIDPEEDIYISLSDEKEYAVAMVIISK